MNTLHDVTERLYAATIEAIERDAARTMAQRRTAVRRVRDERRQARQARRDYRRI